MPYDLAISFLGTYFPVISRVQNYALYKGHNAALFVKLKNQVFLKIKQ